ncbi:MAG: pyruvate kinase [Neisseria sp.]|nr:pyruvate kinase [Neisseria sp.]
MNFWHMQMHPTDEMEFSQNIDWILEHKKIIGLGQWDSGKEQINQFINDIQVNDIVALKRGGKLIALVQVIGGAYKVTDDTNPDTAWIVNRRPIRVLDWAIEERTLPQPRGTLNRCASNDVETTKIIKDWYQRVVKSFEKRKLDLRV